MILTDTGPIVALLDSDDPYHSQCVAAAQRLPGEPFLTTWPCFTEAMYLLGLAVAIAIGSPYGICTVQGIWSCITQHREKPGEWPN